MTTKTRVEMPTADGGTFVCWDKRKDKFFLKYRCGGRWYYQWLTWNCRGGKAQLYKPLVALYKTLRRSGLITDKFHRLAD
jgi:hypothetical protein